MKFALLLVLFLVSSVYSKDRNNKPYKVVCYFESWADYSKGDNHFTAEDINPNVCTHLNYAFAKLKNNTIQLEDPFVDDAKDSGHDMIHRTVNLRKHNPNLTVMISLGGWGEGSTKYSEMASTAAHRHELVESVVKFLQKYDLDGINLDWEYPGFSGVASGERKPGRVEDKQNYIHLIQELKEAFKPQGYLLTAAVAAGQGQIDRAYDIANMNKYLDFINLMTYDYHGEWDGVTGYNSPLSAPSENDKTENIHYTVDYWIKGGAEPKKLILGIPLYGKGYKLSGSDHHLGAKATGSHDGGNYEKICQTIKQAGWQVHWDEKAQVPYAVKGQEWISFDNSQSVQKKLEFVLERHLGGSMVWAIDGDDVHGHCGEGKYPLMKLQMKLLNKVEVLDVQIEKPKVQ